MGLTELFVDLLSHVVALDIVFGIQDCWTACHFASSSHEIAKVVVFEIATNRAVDVPENTCNLELLLIDLDYLSRQMHLSCQ